jgi:hypothetical protein
MKKCIVNKAGIPVLAPIEPTQHKPMTGRTIGQNIAISQSYVQRAASHDRVQGGING